LLTNRGLALLCIAAYLDRQRVGRRNRYTIQVNLPISLPAQRDIDLNSLLNVLVPRAPAASANTRFQRPRPPDPG
jgi:hypothetical protein